ncbi:MAG: tRNA lysidine(34) synthetase TilS, partial [Terriglobales bacterium]
QRTAEKLGGTIEFKHVEELIAMVREQRRGKPMALPGGLEAVCTFRELQIGRSGDAGTGSYQYALEVPGQVSVPELGATLRARVISHGSPANSGYNPDLLLDRALLAPGLTVRNWQAGDRFFPAHTGSPKKVKELLQSGRLGQTLTQAERKTWPVVESAGQIVWMKGFAVPEAFAHHAGEAVLIEEIHMNAGTNDEP